MTDREIVDRLVALGIVRRDGDQFFWIPGMPGGTLGEVKLHGGWLHDWRVAGVCLERMQDIGSVKYLGRDTSDVSLCTFHKGWGTRKSIYHAVNESMPRAIIEAYIEAVSDES